MFSGKNRRSLLALGAMASASITAATKPAAPLRLALMNVRPWAGRTSTGELTGILVDLSAQLSTLSGISLSPFLVPYSRALKMLEFGGSDLMFSIDISTSSRPAIALEHLGTVEVVLLAAHDLHVTSLADMRGKTIGYLRGSSLGSVLKADTRINAHPIDSYEQGARMLRAKRLDGMIGVRESLASGLCDPGGAPAEVSVRYVLKHGKVTLYADPSIDQKICTALQKACLQLRRDKALEALLKAANACGFD